MSHMNTSIVSSCHIEVCEPNIVSRKGLIWQIYFSSDCGVYRCVFSLVWLPEEKFGVYPVEEDQEGSDEEMDIPELGPCTEDQELKHNLLTKCVDA